MTLARGLTAKNSQNRKKAKPRKGCSLIKEWLQRLLKRIGLSTICTGSGEPLDSLPEISCCSRCAQSLYFCPPLCAGKYALLPHCISMTTPPPVWDAILRIAFETSEGSNSVTGTAFHSLNSAAGAAGAAGRCWSLYPRPVFPWDGLPRGDAGSRGWELARAALTGRPKRGAWEKLGPLLGSPSDGNDLARLIGKRASAPDINTNGRWCLTSNPKSLMRKKVLRVVASLARNSFRTDTSPCAWELGPYHTYEEVSHLWAR